MKRTILKKMNISFIVHLGLGKYSLILFEHALYFKTPFFIYLFISIQNFFLAYLRIIEEACFLRKSLAWAISVKEENNLKKKNEFNPVIWHTILSWQISLQSSQQCLEYTDCIPCRGVISLKKDVFSNSRGYRVTFFFSIIPSQIDLLKNY